MSETFGKNVKIGDQFWCKSNKDPNLYLRIVVVDRIVNGRLAPANVVNMTTGRLKWIDDKEKVDF
jgi:hypothetical protein